MDAQALKKLRLVINENLRVQRGGSDPVPYIDVSNALSDVAARQNHAIFARRGCGKTLLLNYSAGELPSQIRSVYLNCEDFKKHSFPNVLIEILDALFAELRSQLTGWFGKKKRSRELIAKIREERGQLRSKADRQDTEVREAEAKETRDSHKTQLSVGTPGVAALRADEDLSVAAHCERSSLSQDLDQRNLRRRSATNQGETQPR